MIPTNKLDCAGRDSLLLTVTTPIKDSPAPFHAAMLSFPKGAVQDVLHQLQDKELLSLILDGLDYNPDRLEEATGRMAGRGCPGVGIEPVEMVGYYHLETQEQPA